MFDIFYRGNELDLLIVHSASIWCSDHPITDAAFSSSIDRLIDYFQDFHFTYIRKRINISKIKFLTVEARTL